MPSPARVLLGALLLLLTATMLSPASPASSAVAAPEAGPSTGSSVVPAARKVDPRKRLGLFVDDQMPAAQAAQQDEQYAPIGRRPQAFWITDYYATDQVQAKVRDYVTRAAAAKKTPMLVIYAIPDRDCNLYSAGGMPDAASYRAWIDQAAAGIKGSKPLLVLEPDALPFIGDPQCESDDVALDVPERYALLRYATKKLTAAGAWVYLDAGHSLWHTPQEMVTPLRKAGVAQARGFSTNVSNFRSSTAEKKWAASLAQLLGRAGVKGRKYVIDTSRNGATPQNEWCNPTWARIGKAPQLRFEGAFDGTLWVKHPGESDGECNGGPSSGAWWPAGARRLMGR